MEDFVDDYLAFASEDSEVPAIFHRWSAICGLGAFLGRQFYIQHGHSKYYTNLYAMLVGTSGSRKSTAIKMMKKFLRDAGYDTIAADKTTKEKFMLDLAGDVDDKLAELETALFDNSSDDAEIFVMADEFNDFFGNNNLEFISLLGTLWDYEGKFTNRIKTGKSVSINNPTVSILGGNTPTGISAAFPPEALGQGFFSRLLFIYGEPNGKRIAFPAVPDTTRRNNLLESLGRCKHKYFGELKISSLSRKYLSNIYVSNFGVNDIRFDAFNSRRFSHLLKLCTTLHAASAINRADELSVDTVIRANTYLFAAEKSMPRALGEFGRGKNSEVTHKIISLFESAPSVIDFKYIWQQVSNDLEKMADLATILNNLVAADRIISVAGKGFISKRAKTFEVDESLIDLSLLTPEERKYIST